MDTVWNSGQTEQFMKGNTNTGLRMAKVNLLGQMVANSLDSLSITTFMALVYMSGMMVESIRVIGETTKWKAMVRLRGLMAGNM